MFTIKKKVRRLLIFCFAGLAVAAVGFVLKDFIFPRYEKVTDQVLEVQTEADISYSVHLKDNPIFGQSILPEDGYYLKPFIDYVDVTCNLSASADKATDIEATTTVDVSLVSQLGSGDDAEVIWEKTQTYAPAETSISADGQMSLDRIVKLDFAQYDALINELIDEYDLVTDYYIKVLFSAVVSAGYDGEMVGKTTGL